MKKKTNYTDKDIKLGKKATDFLPSPAKLALKEETVQITLNLNKKSIEFFKQEAKKASISYQKLIPRVIDLYSDIRQG